MKKYKVIYGYCRISTSKQSIDRQIRNIKAEFPSAVIVSEVFTGTSLHRPEWNKLYNNLKDGACIVFDSVSRMSRNAEEGFALYKELFERNIDLIFLKERHIDTVAYREALDGIISQEVVTGDSATDELVNSIMSAINKFMMKKVEADIYKAFEQSQKEVDDLRQRTKEGIETARLQGKQIGLPVGSKLSIKKKSKAIPLIIKYSKDFNGSLNDIECMKLIGLSNNTYYKYKRDIKNSNYEETE